MSKDALDRHTDRHTGTQACHTVHWTDKQTDTQAGKHVTQCTGQTYKQKHR